MSRERLLVGLEIGTFKVCAVVAESRPDGSLRILGVGESKSVGIRKGEIVDFNSAIQCVRDAIADAEEKADAEIESVWVAVTGSHIHSFNNRGATPIPEDRGEIDVEDIRDVEASAKEVSIPDQNWFIHTITQHYYVDNQEGVVNPIGMMGRKLEADFHIVHGVKTRIQNTLRCVKEASVAAEEVVINSVASAQVVLDQHQKDLGAIMLDIGGGTTDYIVYIDGAVQHSGVLAIGGDHITNDISIGLRIPIARAERLKIEEGSANPDEAQPGDTIILKNDSGFSGCEIERSNLNRIIYARVRELFELVRTDIDAQCDLDLVRSGVMLTGGCCRMRGIQAVCAEVFGQPVHSVAAQEVTGPTSVFQNPQYATAIGVVKYAQLMQMDDEPDSLFGAVGKKIGSIFRRRANA
ncbi:MAG: cell division protein FtsA [Terrimicrobiaceae bacterium]|nr:cell division protein FtsA [Terrimicrobiaceae bacterium]